MAGLHTSDDSVSDRKARPRPAEHESPAAAETEAPRPRIALLPEAGTIVEVAIGPGVVVPATVARVQEEMIWIRMPGVIPGGHDFHFVWANRQSAWETTAAAIMHTDEGGLMARAATTQRVDRRAYDRMPPRRRVLIRAMLFDVAGDDSVGTIFGQLADASFAGACFRTAGAPTIGQSMMLWFRDDEHGPLGQPVPAKVVSVTPEGSKSRLVRVAFGRVGLAAGTLRNVIMGFAEPTAAA